MHTRFDDLLGSGVTCRRMSCHKNRYAPPLEAILAATIRGGRLSDRLTVTAAAGHNAGSGALQSTHRGRHRTPRVVGGLVCLQVSEPYQRTDAMLKLRSLLLMSAAEIGRASCRERV